MMTSVSGTRGIGKTYHLSVEVKKRFDAGDLIITNFSHAHSHIDCSNLSVDEFHGVLRQVLLFKEMGYEPVDLFSGFRHTGIFIAMDEGHLYFGADEAAKYRGDKHQEIIKLLAQARKQDVEIWYTVQDPSKIDKNWRRYTEIYIRYRAVIGWRFWKFVEYIRPEPLPPTMRREMRYIVPLVWEEYHELDQANPVFNYAVSRDADGFTSWSKHSTMIRRRIRKSGWLKKWPYKLYNHNQVVAVKHEDNDDMKFPTLREMAWIQPTYKPDKLARIKTMFGLDHWRTDLLPTKVRQKTLLELPPPIDVELRKNILMQPAEFLDALSDLIKKGRKKRR